MKQGFLSFTFALSVLLPALLYSSRAADSASPNLQQSLEGNNLAPSSVSDEDISIFHSFPFTDKRMKANQAKYERMINDFIIDDLDASKNVTEASAKYPQDSPVRIVIEKKFAYHLFIEENMLTLYTMSYDLALDSCGVNPQNLKAFPPETKRGNIFNLQAVPNKKYKTIIESMIKSSSFHTKAPEEQEIPLFITLHPSLTFLPAATIEDTLENIRLDFQNFNVRYCTACPNVLPYDEYAYLTWLSILNYDATTDNSYFKEKDQLVVNLGLSSEVVFVSYPYELIATANEDDKVVPHSYCLNKQMHITPFVQNAYYERGLEKFATNFLTSILRDATDEVKFPCYPKYFEEKVEGITVKGTGDFEKCKKEVTSFLNKKPEAPTFHDFNLHSSEVIWPLDSLKDNPVFHEVKIYIESEPLESLLKVGLSDDKFSAITVEALNTKIEKNCTEFLSEEVKSLVSSKNTIEYTNSCLNLVYISSLLKKMGIKERELKIKIRSQGSEAWIKGITLRNLDLFHNLEKEWFNSVQDRALESYLIRVKDNQELERQKAMNFTFILIALLSITFWAGFIVRFRIKDVPEAENVKYK